MQLSLNQTLILTLTIVNYYYSVIKLKVYPLLSHIKIHHSWFTGELFTGESNIMDTGLWRFEVKNSSLWIYYKYAGFHKTFIDVLEGCGLLWCFYELFGLILTAPIHCRGSIGEQVMWCYISPNLFWWTNKQTHLHLGWPDGEYI